MRINLNFMFLVIFLNIFTIIDGSSSETKRKHDFSEFFIKRNKTSLILAEPGSTVFDSVLKVSFCEFSADEPSIFYDSSARIADKTLYINRRSIETHTNEMYENLSSSMKSHNSPVSPTKYFLEPFCKHNSKDRNSDTSIYNLNCKSEVIRSVEIDDDQYASEIKLKINKLHKRCNDLNIIPQSPDDDVYWADSLGEEKHILRERSIKYHNILVNEVKCKERELGLKAYGLTDFK